MVKMTHSSKILLLAVLLFAPGALAIDTLKWPDSGDMDSPKEKYKYNIAKMAMEKTVAQFGPYRIDAVPIEVMTPIRAKEVVRQGTKVNIYVALTTNDWEHDTIPVRIPIRRGILNYRLLLVHQNNRSTFANINSLEELKHLKVGSQLGWATTDILKAEGFNVVRGTKPDGMFYMLDGGRFDYLPRGINEIFNEQEKYKDKLQNTVAPNIALNLPAPTYFFVSPSEPGLAKRLEAGLEIMVKDGSLKAIFNAAYGDALKIADLKSRKIISIKNSSLPPLTPLDRKELWYDPFEEDLPPADNESSTSPAL